MAERDLAQPRKPEELGLHPFDRHDPRPLRRPHVPADAGRTRSRDQAALTQALSPKHASALGRRVTNAYVGANTGCNQQQAAKAEEIKWTPTPTPLPAPTPNGAPG